MSVADLFPKRMFEEAAERQKFWNENYHRLLALYPEQFVAVRDGEVIATSHDLYVLVDKLRDLGLSPTDVAIKLITAKAGSLIL